jgi:hypothetical protein
MSDVTDLHAVLKAEAIVLYSAHILARTPPSMQTAMQALVATDQLNPWDSSTTHAVVANGAVINAVDLSDVALGTVVAAVAANAVTNVKLTPAATKAIVTHGGNVVVHDNGGGTNAKSPAIANVTGHTFNFATLAA